MSEAVTRSPELLSRADSALLVVDVQPKLLGLLPDRRRIVWNLTRLAEAAQVFGIPVIATEQNPARLGGTISELASLVGQPTAKLDFSCGSCPEIFAPLRTRGVYKLLIAGIETHVCVLQTALDLVAEGFRVFVAADASGSRNPLDEQLAWRRLEAAGVTLVSTEAALFEWCERAGTPEFRRISELVKQPGPEAS